MPLSLATVGGLSNGQQQRVDLSVVHPFKREGLKQRDGPGVLIFDLLLRSQLPPKSSQARCKSMPFCFARSPRKSTLQGVNPGSYAWDLKSAQFCEWLGA